MKMIDVLANPPMPDWNDLRMDERDAIRKVWEAHKLDEISALECYRAIREVLRARERRVFLATMRGP